MQIKWIKYKQESLVKIFIATKISENMKNTGLKIKRPSRNNISPWNQDIGVLKSYSSSQQTPFRVLSSQCNSRQLSTAQTQRQIRRKQMELNRPQSAFVLPTKHAQIPIFTQSSTQLHNKSQLGKKFNNLGLEDFMKEIITGNISKNPQLSEKVVFALNRTYLSTKMASPRRKSTVSIGPKTRSVSNRTSYLEPKDSSQVFMNINPNKYIPNTMFPYRKQHTKLLRGKQYGRYNAKKIQEDTCIQSQINERQQYYFQQQLKKIAEQQKNASRTKKNRPRSSTKNSMSQMNYISQSSRLRQKKREICEEKHCVVSRKAVIYK